MSSINRVTLLGHTGAAPEIRYTPDGTPVATISIATNRHWKDKKTGEQHEDVEWTRVVLWGRLAEVAETYLHKGSRCHIDGRLRTRKWQDKQTGQDRYATEVVGLSLILLDRRDGNPVGEQPASASAVPPETGPDPDDDIPL